MDVNKEDKIMAENVSLMALLEAVLFLSHEPLPINRLQEICNASKEEIISCLEMLRLSLESKERGLTLKRTIAGYRLGTKPELSVFLSRLWEEEQIAPVLSQAALETLAIIAAKQPVTRIEIEKIRGVSAEGVLENLLKRKLIKVSGRREGFGRPHLYVTTEYFLDYFGLKDLGEVENLFGERTD